MCALGMLRLGVSRSMTRGKDREGKVEGGEEGEVVGGGEGAEGAEEGERELLYGPELFLLDQIWSLSQ